MEGKREGGRIKQIEIKGIRALGVERGLLWLVCAMRWWQVPSLPSGLLNWCFGCGRLAAFPVCPCAPSTLHDPYTYNCKKLG